MSGRKHARESPEADAQTHKSAKMTSPMAVDPKAIDEDLHRCVVLQLQSAAAVAAVARAPGRVRAR